MTDVRSEKEIRDVIKDYDELSGNAFEKKYGLQTMRECVGFWKACKFYLKEEYDKESY